MKSHNLKAIHIFFKSFNTYLHAYSSMFTNYPKMATHKRGPINMSIATTK